MISTRTSFNVQPLQQTIAFLDDFEDQVETIARQTARDIQPFLLDELRVYPARQPTFPFIWSNDPAANARARRYYFAVVAKNNPGGRYQRTGAYANSWRVRFTGDGLRVSSDYRGARWTGGSLARDVQRARRWQIPSHRATGWPVSSVTINYWFEVYREELVRRVQAQLGGAAVSRNRRATFTSARRR